MHTRPTQTAHWWPSQASAASLLAGRDLRSGGSWMGISSNGRFAAVTNVASKANTDATLASRGQLVIDWLSTTTRVENTLQSLPQAAASYNPFSLLLADGTTLGYASHQGIDQYRLLTAGIYGLSNHCLDSSWLKISSGKNCF